MKNCLIAHPHTRASFTGDTLYPNVNDGVEGMYFIEQSVASSNQGGAWLPMRHKRARK